MSNAHIITPDQITLFIEGEMYNVPRSSPHFGKIKELLLTAVPTPWDDIEMLADVTGAINEWGEGGIRVNDGVLTYNGMVIENVLSRKIIQGIEEGNNVTPFIRFMENLMQNPSKQSIDELYLFMEKANLPLTEDGHFLAYKGVRSDYMDRHSGTFSNRVGDICEVPRQSVDDDRRNLCSHGLHFCALSYLREMWGFGGKTMIVKINPKDVVSIPYDYGNAKGRTARYEVIGEISDFAPLQNGEDFSNAAVYEYDDVDEDSPDQYNYTEEESI